MRYSHIAACIALLLPACSQPLVRRSARIACGDASPKIVSDTGALDIALDSAARATVHQIDLEVGEGAAAQMQLDSLAVSCWSATPGLRVSLTGAWSKSPHLQAGTGTHFARTTVYGGGVILFDTILDMTGPVYRSLSWGGAP